MKTRLLQSLLFAALFAGLGTSANAQERSIRSFAQRIERVTTHSPWRPKARATDVSASRYRGSYRSPVRGYGSRGYAPRATPRVWIPGRFEKVAYKVLIPERFEKIWVAPVYETRYRSCGTAYQVLVRSGFWKEICHPARYETRYKKHWVAGRYEVRTAVNCRL